MIFDNIKNCKTYYGAHPKFEKAFSFIEKAFSENLEVGKYEIDGKEIYAFIQEYESKLIENSLFEGHENYIDIQCIMEGREIMGNMEISNAVIRTEYNPERDFAIYERNEFATYCVAGRGDFSVFFPQDIHSPGVSYKNEPSKIRKIVVKVHM